jgi:hypothetical protein
MANDKQKKFESEQQSSIRKKKLQARQAEINEELPKVSVILYTVMVLIPNQGDCDKAADTTMLFNVRHVLDQVEAIETQTNDAYERRRSEALPQVCRRRA